MKSSFRVIAFFSLIVPSLFLSSILLMSLNSLHHAETIQLPLSGYDPVSLLHGHYLRIRFDRNAIFEGKNSRSSDTIRCLCFNKNGHGAWKATTVICSSFAGKSCSRLTPNQDFLDQFYRYYVDERQASLLEDLLRTARLSMQEQQRFSSMKINKNKKGENIKLPQTAPQFSMDVAMLEDGAIALKMLLIDGKPWKEYLQERAQIKK